MSKIYDALKRAERERENARERGRETNGHSAEAPLARGDGQPQATGQEEDDYRRLRASLLFAPAYSDVRTIAVTGTRHGEGATRVAIGLARALAGEGDTQVLLVEGNLRTPSFTQVLPIGKTPGLAEFLAGEASAASLIAPLREWNLSVITAGLRPGVIDCEAMAGAVSQVMDQFDFVIMDLPPVNRYADASILAPKVDGVILVVEADRTPVVDAESAKKSLDRVGARIFGVVLNRRRSYVPATLQALL
ncbi:MAG: CpsD/CapB family tyrosine-protein kinase [Deltaproteobacteria bacterium]|nr:CpsD/CapB family tyrosine-protein kinase [Deltaproteobacteria bacterium]